MSNFKWPSIYRWHCPYFRGNLEILIWSKMWKITFFFNWKIVEFWSFLQSFLKIRNAQAIKKNTNKNKQFSKTKSSISYLIRLSF